MQTYIPEKPRGCVRLVTLCDTRGVYPNPATVPMGDILIHSGEFSTEGIEEELVAFVEWLEALPHRHKLVVAGDTSLKDIAFNSAYYEPVTSSNAIMPAPWSQGLRHARILQVCCREV